MDQINETRDKHEFLTFLLMNDGEDCKCGVVQNSNNRFITFYDLDRIQKPSDRKKFLELADRWWWESGQVIPVDCYIGTEFDMFQEALCILPRKLLSDDPIGPTYSITENYLKRVKKRRVDLVNRRRVAD